MLAPIPLRPPGGGARDLPGGAGGARRRARHRARPRATRASRGDPPAGPRARRAPLPSAQSRVPGAAFVGARARARRAPRRPRTTPSPGADASSWSAASRASARAASPRSWPPRPRARGAHVLIGRCWEAGGAPAYWPWMQALRTYVREGDAHVLARAARRGAADLAQIMPELRERLPDLPDAPRSTPRAARFRLFDATGEFLRSAAAADRSCSCSTTCTRPTTPRCSCCSSSRASSGRAGCSCSAPTATSTRCRETGSLPMLAEIAREPVVTRLLAGRAERVRGRRVRRAHAPRSWRRRGSPPRCTRRPTATRCSSVRVVRLLSVEGAPDERAARDPAERP